MGTPPVLVFVSFRVFPTFHLPVPGATPLPPIVWSPFPSPCPTETREGLHEVFQLQGTDGLGEEEEGPDREDHLRSTHLNHFPKARPIFEGICFFPALLGVFIRSIFRSPLEWLKVGLGRA